MRSQFAGVLVVLVVLTAGCTGVLLGDDDVVFEAGETLIEDDTATAAGYELQHAERQELDRTVPVADGTRVVVRNHVAMYGPRGGPSAESGSVVIGLTTTPDATVAGQSVNPLLRIDDYERVYELLPQTEGSSLERRDTYTVEPFDEPANVTVFAVEPEDGGEPEALVHVMRTRAESDVVLAYAVHPVETDERETIERLFSALEHTPADETSGA